MGPVVPDERVALERQPVLLAEGDGPIGRRAAPDVGASLGKTNLARFGLQVVPVEGDGGKVEQLQEGFLVGRILLLHLADNEHVAAEEELV